MPGAVRVLIVEDEPLVSEMIRGQLEAMGYLVVGEANDGAQAVALTVATRPDVVIMDIQMRQMNGIEAADRIQSSCPTPVVVLTAHEQPELVARASAAGVGAYLVKPQRKSDLERAITVAMARFGDLVQLRRMNAELEARSQELHRVLADVKTLQGLLPICSSCKKIRDDRGYWNQLGAYLEEHAAVEVSHSLCPSCARDFYGGVPDGGEQEG